MFKIHVLGYTEPAVLICWSQVEQECHHMETIISPATLVYAAEVAVLHVLCRLQQLESSHGAISSEIDHIKALGTNIEEWKHQMNDAGAQAAAVLALVQTDGTELRSIWQSLCSTVLNIWIYVILIQSQSRTLPLGVCPDLKRPTGHTA